MSLEAAIYDVISSASGVTTLIGGARSPRVYPAVLPQGKPVPAIVYSQDSSRNEESCNGAVDPRTDQIEITCWDDDPDGARTLAEAVRSALKAAGAKGSHGSVIVIYWHLLDERDVYETADDNETLTRYGKRQEWELCYEP